VMRIDKLTIEYEYPVSGMCMLGSGHIIYKIKLFDSVKKCVFLKY
jgi:hypothetical protein